MAEDPSDVIESILEKADSGEAINLTRREIKTLELHLKQTRKGAIQDFQEARHVPKSERS